MRDVVFGLAFSLATGAVFAHEQVETRPVLPENNIILLTVFLIHDQSMNNVECRKLLDANRFDDRLPPDGVEIVDHCIMLGIGRSSCCACRRITCA